MSTHDISKEVMNEIARRGVAPISRWRENLKKSLVWVAAFLALLVGGLAFSVLIFLHSGDTLDLYGRLGPVFVLKNLPYFWFVALGIFLYLGERYYRQTTLGYRHTLPRILIFYVAGTMLVGVCGMFLGVGGWIETTIIERAHFYRGIIGAREVLWDQPQDGLLAGTVVSKSTDVLMLRSFSNVVWTIDIHNAILKGGISLESGGMVKIIGNRKEDNLFVASEIRPWEGRGQGRNYSTVPVR